MNPVQEHVDEIISRQERETDSALAHAAVLVSRDDKQGQTRDLDFLGLTTYAVDRPSVGVERVSLEMGLT